MTPLNIPPSALAWLYMGAALIAAIIIGAVSDRLFFHRRFHSAERRAVRVPVDFYTSAQNIPHNRSIIKK